MEFIAQLELQPVILRSPDQWGELQVSRFARSGVSASNDLDGGSE